MISFSTMSDEKKNVLKKSRKSITLDVKNRILNEHNSGMKVNELASKFKLSHSTVSTILRHKERYIKEIKNARPLQSTIIRRRNGLLPEVERILITWINHQTHIVGVSLNQTTISAKALSIFQNLKKMRGEASKDEVFTASKGWYDRFKKRASWYSSVPEEPLLAEIEEEPKKVTYKKNIEEMNIVKNEAIEGETLEVKVSPYPAFTMQKFSEAFECIEKALKIFITNDPNFDRSLRVATKIRENYTCYREMYAESLRSSLDNCFAFASHSRQSMEDDSS